MLLSWIVFPAVMVAVWAGCGLAVLRLTPGGLPRGLVLPVGFAVALVIASSATATESTARLAAPLVLALAVTGFLVARDRRAWIPDPWAGGAALGVFLVFGAPVLATGTATFTGYIQLDDIATWLAITDQVAQRGRDLSGLEAASSFRQVVRDYLPSGYPVGAFLPLGLGHDLMFGRDIAWLFAPMMAVTSGLLALTLTEIVRPVLARPWARAVVAFLAAQSALLVAYAEWGAIKEVTAALLVALTAALAPTLAGHWRRILPLAVAVAAVVAALSLGGGVWVVPIVLVGLAGARARPRALPLPIGVTTVLVLALSIPSLVLAKTFLQPQVASGSVLTAATELGNLRAPLPLSHLLGIWPAGDFRTDPEQATVTTVLLVLVVLAAAAGLGLAVQRRAGALVGYVVGGVAACGLLVSRGSPWVDAKAMATAAPMVLTLALAALAFVATERFRPVARRAALVCLVLLGGGVLWSNVLGYANSYLAPRAQLVELESAGELLAGQGPTLLTEYEPYGARHFLRRAGGESASERRERLIPLRDGSQLPKSAAADVGAFDPTALREYRNLMPRTSPVASRPPEAYTRIRTGESYELWQRPAQAPIPPVTDLPLGDGAQPGAIPPCASVRALAAQVAPRGRLVAVERDAVTTVELTGTQLEGGLQPNADRRVVVPLDDGRLTTEVTLREAGEYRVWLGGSTRGRTTIRVDGRQTGSVQGRLNNLGAFMRFGRIQLTAGTHKIELTYDDDGLAPGQRGQEAQPLVLGPLVLSAETADLAPFSVPVARAAELCGKRLDWIEAYAG